MVCSVKYIATVITLLSCFCLAASEDVNPQSTAAVAAPDTTHESLNDAESGEGDASAPKPLSAADRARLEKLIEDADTNGDKVLSEQEVQEWFKTLSRQFHDSWAHEEFERADTDKDNKLSLSEYKEFLNLRIEGIPTLPEEVKLRFVEADVNKDNALDKEEFMQHATHLPLRTPAELEHTANEILDAYDSDRDGVINFSEFVQKAREEESDMHDLTSEGNVSSEVSSGPPNATLQGDKEKAAADSRVQSDEELQAEYSELDLNADGKIDSEELKKMLKQEMNEEDENMLNIEEVAHAQLQEMKDMYPSFKSSGALSFDEILEDLQTFAESPFTAYGDLLGTTQPLKRPDSSETDFTSPHPENQFPKANDANEEL